MRTHEFTFAPTIEEAPNSVAVAVDYEIIDDSVTAHNEFGLPVSYTLPYDYKINDFTAFDREGRELDLSEEPELFNDIVSEINAELEDIISRISMGEDL